MRKWCNAVFLKYVNLSTIVCRYLFYIVLNRKKSTKYMHNICIKIHYTKFKIFLGFAQISFVFLRADYAATVSSRFLIFYADSYVCIPTTRFIRRLNSCSVLCFELYPVSVLTFLQGIRFE